MTYLNPNAYIPLVLANKGELTIQEILNLAPPSTIGTKILGFIDKINRLLNNRNSNNYLNYYTFVVNWRVLPKYTNLRITGFRQMRNFVRLLNSDNIFTRLAVIYKQYFQFTSNYNVMISRGNRQSCYGSPAQGNQTIITYQSFAERFYFFKTITFNLYDNVFVYVVSSDDGSDPIRTLDNRLIIVSRTVENYLGNFKITVYYSFNDNGSTKDGVTFYPNDITNPIWTNKSNLIEILQFNGIPLSRESKQFNEITNDNNLAIGFPSDAPTILSNTNATLMFGLSEYFNEDISNWETSGFTNCENMFEKAKRFNQDINNWNVSNVTNMRSMFDEALKFNQNLNSWDVSNVTSMESMFLRAEKFNGNISSWNVSNVTNMRSMFNEAFEFNQNLNSWDVSNVTNMESMFFRAENFNGDISSWDVSNVTNMSDMFYNCIVFNADISSWNVSNVTNMSNMFNGAKVFNADISSWNVSKVTNMSNMFQGAVVFNHDIRNWDVGPIPPGSRIDSVLTMNVMFFGATEMINNYGPIGGLIDIAWFGTQGCTASNTNMWG